MSRLEELIQQLCPKGVEWTILKEIANIGTGSSDRKNAVENGLYPFYVRSKDVLRINTYEFDETAIIIPGEGGIGEIFHYVKGKYALHQRAYRINIIDDVLNSKFVYYFMIENFKKFIEQKAVNATVTSIRKPMIEEFPIPLPSLPIQEEIVRILDTFTGSINNLKEQIQTRRKQYEYYRDQLLDLEGKDGVEMKTLGEIGDVCMCRRIIKSQTSDKGDVPFYKIGTFGSVADSYISRELFESYKKMYSYPKKGDVLISASGTIGRTVVFDGKESYFQDSNIVWIDNNEELVTNSFLRYLYEIIEWKTDGGAIKRLYNYNLKSAIIHVPPLAEQQRIVDILDQFETSIANLEAQLKQREKQYEYYRNQLLDFKRNA